MKEDIEFQEIGRKTSYKVPDGFFEQVSEKTLQKAKQREQNRRKSIVLWRTVAVAASLAAVFLIGYFNQDPDLKTESNLIVQEKQRVEQPVIQKQEITKQPELAEIRKAVPEKIITKDNGTEVIGDVLADLSDEELMQLAAMYKTDPFISESGQ
jgi:hypothetical protein